MRKILVVEDDRLVRATLVQGLTAHGFEAIEAAHGEEALAKASDFKPELALVDVCLPGMSGAQVAEILDKRYGVAVLFLSAYDDRATVQEALRSGGVGYLLKPLTVAQLLPELEAAVAVQSKLKALQAEQAKLVAALEHNRLINQAVGVLMERLRLSRLAAYEVLRQRARRERRKVAELAAQVVEWVDDLNQLAEQ